MRRLAAWPAALALLFVVAVAGPVAGAAAGSSAAGSSGLGAGAAGAAATTSATPATPATPSRSSSSPAAAQPPPMFAFYYQWFDPNSWKRAKIDLPELGAYSSDDPLIMRQHIQEAKAAGIAGFIVSWKDTPTNTRRLRALVAVASQEHFLLSMIYQGLDFNRHPLAVTKVAADFAMFAKQFAGNPVFARLGGKVLTIWSGTWAYSHAEVTRVTAAVRPGMLVLNTEKSLDGYRRLADVTDGDAYYWSSVNPATNPTYATKLNQLSSAIHADGKYWIAPLAPGFDARLVGGSKAVPRADGATLRAEYGTALKSSPDLLGLISWNEFSENTYVEPSKKFGHRYLDVVADLRQARAPVPPAAADSSSPAIGAKPGRNWPSAALLIGFPVLLIVGVGLLARRRRRAARPPPPVDHSTGTGAFVSR
jgi:hypothetical protein